MKRLSSEELVDYLDGTLDVAHRARVETHLAQSAEDAQLVADLKMAQEALRDWKEAEPVVVSADFWPRLRDKLPAQPGRSPWRSMTAKLGAWLWPEAASLRTLRVAALAGLLFLGATFFAPQHDVQPVMAGNEISQADMAFVRQGVKQHEAFVASQPALPPGDAAASESGDDEEDEGFTP